MKVFWSLLLASLIFASSAQAQNKLGLLGGVNFAQLHAKGMPTNAAAKLMAGLSFETQITSSWSLAPQLRYIDKSGKDIGAQDGSKISFDYSLGYLEIPLYAKFKFRPVGAANFYAFGGPSVGLRVKGRTATNINNVNNGSYQQEGPKLHPLDFSVSAGAGAEFSIGEDMELNANAAYGLGLSHASDVNVTTRGLQFFFGWTHLF